MISPFGVKQKRHPDTFPASHVPGTHLAGRVLQYVEQLANPVISLTLGQRSSLLVLPVGGNSQLGNLVHLRRSDLDFDTLHFRADQSSVQRLAPVQLGVEI